MAGKRKKGTGMIRLRQDGRWEGRFITKYENGKPVTKSVFAKSKSECLEKMRVAKDEAGLPPERINPEMCFGNWLKIWYKYYSSPRLRDSTCAGIENILFNHVIPKIGDIPLNQLSQKDLQQFYNESARNGRLVHRESLGPGLSSSLIRNIHRTCHSALEKAKQDGLIVMNPADNCKIPPKQKANVEIMTKDEMYRFLIQARDEGYFELFLLALSTGLRRGEIVGLRWNDLDVSAGTLTIRRQATCPRGVTTITKPKTNSSIRTIAISPQLIQVLSDLHKKVGSEWMFPSPVKPNSPLNPSSLGRCFAKILDRSNCKHIRFHDLRHTFATNALECGIDIKTLSAVLGHVSSATTLDVYAHITNEMQQKAAVQIEAGINKNSAPEAEESAHDSDQDQVYVDTLPYYEPFVPKMRRSGSGCISMINDHLYEGKYSPTWPDGKRRSRNVYAQTREECEVKLESLIAQMKDEIQAVKDGTGVLPKEKISVKQRIEEFACLHPTMTNKSLIAREMGINRRSVQRYYDEVWSKYHDNNQ